MKGVTYSGINDPKLPPSARLRWEQIAARRSVRTGTTVTAAEVASPILAAHNARWAVVGNCGVCAKPLVAGEWEPHYLNAHVSDRARSVVRMLLDLPAGQRSAAVDAVRELGKAPNIVAPA